MIVYHAVVHKEEGCTWGASFPDLPGCFSAADELDGLRYNASEAIELYLEGETAPDPSPLEKIREMAGNDLAGGAFLMEVSYAKTDKIKGEH